MAFDPSKPIRYVTHDGQYLPARVVCYNRKHHRGVTCVILVDRGDKEIVIFRNPDESDRVLPRVENAPVRIVKYYPATNNVYSYPYNTLNFAMQPHAGMKWDVIKAEFEDGKLVATSIIPKKE